MLSDPNVGFEKSDPNQAYKRALYRGCGFRTKDLSQPIIAIVDYLSTSRKKKIEDAIKENIIPLRTSDFQFSPEERYDVILT
jgi:hypothetical protein